MMYPLVRELAAAGAPIRVPVAVTCRVLGLARQPYYRWLACPVTDAEYTEAYRANALFDAHCDDPEFGYRFLVDEAALVGEAMADPDRVEDLLTEPLVVLVRQAEEAPWEGQEARAAGPRRLGRRDRGEGPDPA
ncbi:MAG: hypothetical protein ACRCYU_07595 [Nocardioides sp.]